ncbi:MAG: zinc-dependent peptidase [Myxococcales bacterium FL481]|nr:MAG: zinc-dependent peptidase [Myxococcales bacterium FL481]
MLSWLRDRRRQAILETPFPTHWDGIMGRNVPHVTWLSSPERQHLRELVQVFVAEKRWEGAGGLTLTDEVRVTIAAQACLLILGLEHELYRRVESIVVYPSTVVPRRREPSVLSTAVRLADQPMPILGQAFVRGPVILVWDAVRSGGRDPVDGKNVVYHEFAHKLDMLTGHADGVPPLADRETYHRWVSALTHEYDQLQQRFERGRSTFLDAYALTNGAEFFAVATEFFFERPETMARDHTVMYEVLQAFYRQDPAARLRTRGS